MHLRSPWADIAFGPFTLTLATIVFTVAITLGTWPVTIGSAGFIILHSAANVARDRSIVRRLGRDYDLVQRRAVQVVSDLGQLAADQFDLWMVDLYLCEWDWSPKLRRPFKLPERVLSRQLSVSLIAERHPPPTTDLQSGLHGMCFQEAKPFLWINEAIHGESPDNAWATLEDSSNNELTKSYGVLNVSPLIDQLGKRCVGVMAVHVGPERDVVHKALGALRSPQGCHRINNACVELHALLVR